ncbi:GATA transcription factor 11 [Linum grandiflorum]
MSNLGPDGQDDLTFKDHYNMNDSWFFDNFRPEDFSLENLDFPLEDVDPALGDEDWQTQFKDLEPPSVFLPSFPSDICGPNGIEPVKVEDTSVLQNGAPQLKKWFRTSSPVSVLENSSSSCSAENQTPNQLNIVTGSSSKRPRSKGKRTQRRTYEFFHRLFSGERLHPVAPLNSDPDSYINQTTSPSNLVTKQAKKKKNPTPKAPVVTRKCSHCSVTQTPQWREGPMGPKTLCNACGVRHRSGRLFPEYRPAGSPTFIPALHSNSHRKVLEMRMKASTPEAPASNGFGF